MSLKHPSENKPLLINENPYIALVLEGQTHVLGENIQQILIGKGHPEKRGEPENPGELAVITIDTSEERREKLGLKKASFFAAMLATLGFSDADIGGKRHVAAATIKAHLTRTYQHIGMHARRGLARYFIANDVFSLDPESPCPKFDLQPRQIQTLNELSYGETYHQAAQALKISECTVKTHLENIEGKMGCVEPTARVLCAFASQEITIDMPSLYCRDIAPGKAGMSPCDGVAAMSGDVLITPSHADFAALPPEP